MSCEVGIVHTMPEGTTERQEFDVLKNGSTFNASAVTVVGLRVTNKDGVLQTIVGTVEWVDQTKSRVGFNPDATDLPASGSPYRVRFQFSQAGVTFFSPSTGDGDKWIVQI